MLLRHGPRRCGGALALLLSGTLVLAPLLAPAAERGPDPPPVPAAGSGEGAEGKTLKERLSDKASDEQRVDNCGVPRDRRGARPRPDCAPIRAPSARSN